MQHNGVSNERHAYGLVGQRVSTDGGTEETPGQIKVRRIGHATNPTDYIVKWC